jgi:hypothetical protein
MPESTSFEYAVIRVVPYVERQEFVNVGIILFCKTLGFLEAMIDFELKRLTSFSPKSDLKMIRDQLQTISTICSGGAEAGHFGKWSKSERFNWLVSPSSTIIQTSPAHSGISDDPSEALKRLYAFLVGWEEEKHATPSASA